MASDQVTVAALSRPFALGMLYDARRDKLKTDFTLWDREMIEKCSTRQTQTSSTYEITASDSIESKSSLLDLSASLKASFLSGLIEVGGSASFLNDNKKFKNQSRVTLQFKATTSYERLTMTHLDAKAKQLQDIVKESCATHVVTGILYGANAFFVFDSEKQREESSSVKNIEASMQAAIKKIPSFTFETSVGVKLSKEEKGVTDKFSCKFYGDFILDINPSTFEEAVKTYSQLPKLLEKNVQKAVPVKVWLTPLKTLYPTAEEMKGKICVGLLRKAENALENIKEMEMRCNDSLHEDVVQSFPQIHKKLKRFQNLCQDYKTILRQTMDEKVHAIHEGKDESSLETLLKDQKNSPFSQENLDKWLDNAEREINLIGACVEEMKGIKITKDGSEIDRVVLAHNVDDVLCFVFTSVGIDDEYLGQMEEYLHNHDSNDISFSSPTKEHWFFFDEVSADMRKKTEDFCSIAKGLKSSSKFSFTVASETNGNYKGATIYHYRKGIRITDDFSKPDVSDLENVNVRQNLIWYACDLTLDPNTANNYLILSEGNKKASIGPTWQTYHDIPQRFDTKTQVLCREGLTGRHYWEVEWSNDDSNNVGVAVAYQSIIRKGKSAEAGLNSSTRSWHFDINGQELSAGHEGQIRRHTPAVPCTRVGVFLNWPAGTLSFYQVSCNTLSHFYTYHTSFTEPVYPGLYVVNASNFAALRLV